MRQFAYFFPTTNFLHC